MFRDLQRGNFVGLGPALSRRPLPIAIGAVETQARSSSPKLMPMPENVADVEDLIFTPDPEELNRQLAPRRTRPAPRPTTDILAELARATPLSDAPMTKSGADAATTGISSEEREQRVAAVLSEILGDPESGYRTDSALYQDFLVRLRMRRVNGSPMPLSAFRHRIAVARSGVDAETASTEAWETALRLSRSVSEDLQGVFLMLANAAIRGEACPSDARIARAYGTHSARRARRLLGYFEEQELIIVHADQSGKRIVGIPELQAETAPGAADAPDEDHGSAEAAE